MKKRNPEIYKGPTLKELEEMYGKKETLMITNKELKHFMEYIETDDLSINIGINQENQVMSNIIWHYPEGSTLRTQYSICLSLRKITAYRGISMNVDIDDFFKMMRQWEHEYCVFSDLGGNDYSFFDYVKDKWSVSKKG